MNSPRGMLRTEAVALIAKARSGAYTIATMQPVAAWKAIGQHDERNLNLIGSMGSASAIGLGLALAQPDVKVLILDGDGSIMMQLGTLVSIGAIRPRNLHHIVFNNGCYETSGRQPVPGATTASLVDLALAAGYKRAVEIDDATSGLETLQDVLCHEGPTFVSFIISGQGQVTPQNIDTPARTASFAKQISSMRTSFEVAQ